ncbi:MAG: tyrosine-type recombinase/integrase [Acidobacteria bacterium]|nr:tyrosine-type recombinase/integrase [Acidobacteriota bacterium]
MLTAYRRHTKRCPHRGEGRKYRRCRCPIWADGMLSGVEIRESLKLRDWEKAQARIREWEATGSMAQEEQPITCQAAFEDFKSDLKRRNLARETIRKYEFLFERMKVFGEDRGTRYLKEFDLPTLRQFRDTWTEGNHTALKKLERLRSFMSYAVESKWIDGNPTTKIKNPKVVQRPTMPFTQDQMVRILAACDKYKDCYGRTAQWNARRLRAFVLLLRYSGLRIGDAVRLSRDRIVDGKLFLYTQKTDVPVHCPLPPFVVDSLDSFEPANDRYFFWTGASDRDGVTRNYMRYLKALFELAEVPGGHAHRFRDTFAVELLLKGVPLERVSVLLGHRSIKVTERHYAPWVRARQEQLEADVRRTWGKDPLAFRETKGTPEVHEKREAVN